MENKGCCMPSGDKGCSTEKTGACETQKCCGTIIKGALVGGIVMFAVFIGSWKLMPWHQANVEAITSSGALVPSLIKAFFLYAFGAALLTTLLKKVSGGCCPVLCSALIALLVAAFSYIPNMIWHSSPLVYALYGMADIFIAFTLAGLVISKLILKSGVCTMGKCSTEKPDDKKGSCH